MGPIGPGGYEMSVSVTSPTLTFVISFAPLSWALLFRVYGGSDYAATSVQNIGWAMVQIGPLKFVVQKAIWTE